MRRESPIRCLIGLSLVLAGTAVLTLFGATNGTAGGFPVADQSARTSALGATGAASTRDPSGMFWNPAVLAHLRGTHFSFGAMVMMPEQRFNGILPDVTEHRATPQVLFPPSAYLTHRFGDRFGVGLALNVRFAERVEWGTDWVGAEFASRSECRVISVQPAIGYRLSDDITVGLGVSVNVGRAILEKRLSGTDRVPNVLETYDASSKAGVRFHVGLTGEVKSGLSYGVAFRIKVSLATDDGQLSFQNGDGSAWPVDPQKFSLALGLPAQVETGLTWAPFRWVEFSARGSYTFWSGMPERIISGSAGTSDALTLHWNDAVSAGAGLELSFADMAIRGGVRFEQSPLADAWVTPALPDADAIGFSVGFGYLVEEGLNIDFSYAELNYRERVIRSSGLTSVTGQAFNGIYTARTTAFGLTISYSWD
jgi:long-chain fatty acid transport protein